ncbi:MAG: DUF4303 domain-containing protein [Bacteroidota bacterium]
MDKNKFITRLKESIVLNYQSIKEQDSLISFGIYTDGDASTLSFYYNTDKYLSEQIESIDEEDPEKAQMSDYYAFFMEDWKGDVGCTLSDKRLDYLNKQIYEFGASEYESGNYDYKDEVFDLFTQALEELKQEGLFTKEGESFFLHLEVSDSWIDDEMLQRISRLMSAERFEQYKSYAAYNNEC